MRVRKSVRVNEEIWDSFMRKVAEKEGRTSGGAIGTTVELILQAYIDDRIPFDS